MGNSMTLNLFTFWNKAMSLKIVVLLSVLSQSSCVLSLECDPDKCRIPHCLCPGKDIPGTLGPTETPQMVLFTFDDAVNEEMWTQIRLLFHKKRKNPNGCRIAGTFFVSHNWTDYCMVNRLWASGHEMASHSITHRVPTDWWRMASPGDWSDEIQGQKKILHKKGKVLWEEIRGMRSPFLQSGGDSMYQMVQHHHFEYDSTMVVQELSAGAAKPWPFTLDFPKAIQCILPPCPENSYPGVWEVPVVPLLDMKGEPCTFLDKCRNPASNAGDLTRMLWTNFQNNYKTNRAPLTINVHPAWLRNFTLKGVDNFIRKLLKTEDVWLVTIHQAVAWMQTPTKVNILRHFKPWGCSRRPESRCSIRVPRAARDGVIYNRPAVGSDLGIPLTAILTCLLIIYLGCIKPFEKE